MASQEPWSDRTAADKKRRLSQFTVVYAVVCVLAVVMGWTVWAVVFGLLTVGLGAAWFWTPEDKPERPKPDWMKAMEAGPDGDEVGPRGDGLAMPDTDSPLTPDPEPPRSPEG